MPFTTSQVVTANDMNAVARALDHVTTAVDVASSSAETNIYSKSVGANEMSTNRMLRLTLLGDILHNNGIGDTVELFFKFGATTLARHTIGYNAANAARQPWILTAHLANLGAANSQLGLLTFLTLYPGITAPTTGIGNVDVTGTGSPPYGGVLSGTSAEDTTAAKTLVVSVKWSASSANNSFRMRHATLELV